MTKTRNTSNTPMVLPPHERSSGEIAERTRLVSDIRVPSALLEKGSNDGYARWHDPRVAEITWRRDTPCEPFGGRHLFDIIECVIEREVGEPHTDEFVGYEYEFRAVLTCVRCGQVTQWDGTRTQTDRRHINPVPIVLGDLTAQQCSAVASLRDRDMSNWLVYRNGVEVGIIGWARGQRGRAFHKARLHDWPDGQTVEGNDPTAALRKLVRAARAEAVPA